MVGYIDTGRHRITQMKAIRITKPGEPDVLCLGEVPRPEPGAAEIGVKVHVAGVNRADLLQRRGLYPAPPGWPEDIPGLEYAGVVEEVGSDVSDWKPGDRVMGLVGGGSYAEYVVVHEKEAMAVPEAMSLEVAGAVPEAFITAHDALFTQGGLGALSTPAPGRTEPGSGDPAGLDWVAEEQAGLSEIVLVHAVGSGVGTAALQLAKAAGATVIGTSRTAAKLERAKRMGLDVAIKPDDGRFAEQVLAATDGHGVNVVLELVGGDYLAEDLVVLALRGRVVLVGLMGGASAKLDLGKLLRSRLTVVGTVLRSRTLEEKISATQAAARDVLPLLESGAVRAILDRSLSFGEAAEAHQLVESNETFGKLVLVWN